MIKSIFSLSLLLISLNTFSQNPSILEYKSISINGINKESSKADILNEFGKPDSIYDPNFECGFYSTEQPGVDSVLLIQYSNIEFLLVNERVVFRDIYFDAGSTITLQSEDIVLDKSTNMEYLKKKFPSSYKSLIEQDDNILRLWPCEFCDSEIWIHLKEDKIKRIQFWHPC